MVYVFAVAGLLPLIPAWISASIALHHVRQRAWAHAIGMGIVAGMLVIGSLALILPAFAL